MSASGRQHVGLCIPWCQPSSILKSPVAINGPVYGYNKLLKVPGKVVQPREYTVQSHNNLGSSSNLYTSSVTLGRSHNAFLTLEKKKGIMG